jgi:hypothetical protein
LWLIFAFVGCWGTDLSFASFVEVGWGRLEGSFSFDRLVGCYPVDLLAFGLVVGHLAFDLVGRLAFVLADRLAFVLVVDLLAFGLVVGLLAFDLVVVSWVVERGRQLLRLRCLLRLIGSKKKIQ